MHSLLHACLLIHVFVPHVGVSVFALQHPDESVATQAWFAVSHLMRGPEAPIAQLINEQTVASARKSCVFVFFAYACACLCVHVSLSLYVYLSLYLSLSLSLSLPPLPLSPLSLLLVSYQRPLCREIADSLRTTQV